MICVCTSMCLCAVTFCRLLLAQQTLLLESRHRTPVFLRCRIVSSGAICLWQTRVLLGATAWAEVLQHIPGEPQIKISFAKTGSLVVPSNSFTAEQKQSNEICIINRRLHPQHTWDMDVPGSEGFVRQTLCDQRCDYSSFCPAQKLEDRPNSFFLFWISNAVSEV